MTISSLKEIPISKIVISGDNKRRIDEKSEPFQELKASIKAGGLRVPIQVRMTTKGFELRAGERRLRACKALGLKKVPAVVYSQMEDLEALDLTYIENKFRLDLKPMEEAAEVTLLVERFGDFKVIAKKLGETERWVRLRANLHANLSKAWRDIFEKLDEHPIFSAWTAKHLDLIARLPSVVQDALLEDYLEPFYWDDTAALSANELQEHIAKKLRLLSKAKWDLEDVTLSPKAGACLKCRKRSGFKPQLWFEEEDQVEAGDQCLDGDCFKTKQTALLQRRAKELKEKHPKLVFIQKEPTRGCDDINVPEALGDYLRDWEFKTVPKSTKDALPAMYVNGKSAGQLTYIKPQGCESYRITKEKGKPTPLKERKAKLDCKRWAQVLLDLKEKVAEAKVKDLVFSCKDKGNGLMALVVFYGSDKPFHARADVTHKDAEKLIKAGRAKILERLWQVFTPTLNSLLTYNGPITQTPKQYKQEAEWIAKLIGLDVKALFKDVSSRKGFTEPKAWKTLNADGTSKR